MILLFSGILGILFGLCLGQAPPVDPKGSCDCSIFIETSRSIGSPYAGPLWMLGEDSTEDYKCDDYLMSVCYIYCERQMLDWLESTQSLDDEVEVEVGPGIWETYKYGEFFCRRSYITFPGNVDNYDGIHNQPLLLGVRIAAGDCRSWTVMGDFPEFHLCCDENYQYIPANECPWK